MPRKFSLDLPRLLHVAHDSHPAHAKVTVVMLHGIGGSAGVWRQIDTETPDTIRVITLDLLGFGKSPKPKGASYNLRVQARSVAATLLKLRLRTRVIVVGHSMGSLIAIELAKRYPAIVQGLVLCSPPIYRTIEERQGKLFPAEHLLLGAYDRVGSRLGENPSRYITLAEVASRRGLTAPTFQFNEATIWPYIRALRASIIDQSSYRDIRDLKLPIRMIYGTLDPFIVGANLKTIARDKSNIHLKKIIAMHDIRAPHRKAIVEAVQALLPEFFVERPGQGETSNTDNQ